MQLNVDMSFYWKKSFLIIWKISFDLKNVNRAIDSQRNLEENISDFIINSMPADSMASTLITVFEAMLRRYTVPYAYGTATLIVNIYMVNIRLANRSQYSCGLFY